MYGSSKPASKFKLGILKKQVIEQHSTFLNTQDFFII